MAELVYYTVATALLSRSNCFSDLIFASGLAGPAKLAVGAQCSYVSNFFTAAIA